MAYTTTDIYANFRTDAGQNDRNPEASVILKYYNRAYRGDRSILPRLYPALSALMGALSVSTKYTLAADTHEHAIAIASSVLKLRSVGIKFDSQSDYVYIKNEQILLEKFSESDDIAVNATEGNPALGWFGGNLYVAPQVSAAVASGIEINALQDPSAAIVHGAADLIVADAVVGIIVAEAIRLWYRAMKQWDNAKEARADVEELIFNAKKRTGRYGEVRMQPSTRGGNLQQEM